MTLTHDELIEVGCALLECAFSAREAARDTSDPDQRRRHRERASLLLSACKKIREAHETAPQSHYLRAITGAAS